jgi:predicted AAA+ superfamily ATPase
MAKIDQVIGRSAEKPVLDTVLASKDPELIAVYGRRRVGKTYLIHEHMKPHLALEVVGMHDQSITVQLANFLMSLRKAFPLVPLVQPRT